MKRTEMINKLAETFLIQDVLAEEILDLVESQGMLPPLTDTYVSYTEGGTIKPIPRWERE